MRNITKFENESLYETHMGGGDSVLPNVSWVKDINEVKYGRKVKRIATFEVGEHIVTLPNGTEETMPVNLILINNCSGVKNIKVNGVLTEPDENNQIAVTEVGTYEVEMEFESNEINIDLFNPMEYLEQGFYQPTDSPLSNLIQLNDDFFVGIKNIPALISLISHVNIPNSVKRIDDSAFFCAVNLHDIDIPNSVESIGVASFMQNYISEIKVPDSVESIGMMAFAYNLTGVVVEEFIPGTGFKLELPNNLTCIPQRMCYMTALEYIEIPDSVITIDEGAFYGLTFLTDIKFGNNIKYINDSAFYNTGISSIILPSTLEQIDKNAFYRCSNLSEITCLASSAPILGTSAFSSLSASGVLKVPTGSDYSAWLTQLGNGWTIEYI